MSVDPDQLPVGVGVEGHLTDAGDHQRVENPAQHGDHEHRQGGRDDVL